MDKKKDYFWEKLIGFSLLGGIVSGAIFYFYHNLPEQQKVDVRELVMSHVKPSLAKFLAEKLED